jgi:hypothetical protein
MFNFACPITQRQRVNVGLGRRRRGEGKGRQQRLYACINCENFVLDYGRELTIFLNAIYGEKKIEQKLAK